MKCKVCNTKLPEGQYKCPTCGFDESLNYEDHYTLDIGGHESSHMQPIDVCRKKWYQSVLQEEQKKKAAAESVKKAEIPNSRNLKAEAHAENGMKNVSQLSESESTKYKRVTDDTRRAAGGSGSRVANSGVASSQPDSEKKPSGKGVAMVAACAVAVLAIGLAIISLHGNSDSSETTSLQYAEVGSTVTFGSYEQDNDEGNGAEDIEWIVLDNEDGKLLLLSKYILDSQPYNKTYDEDVRWNNCTLRNWLNEDFYEEAFSEDDQRIILTTEVDKETNSSYPEVYAGEDTQDKLFLLSYSEVEEYLTSEDGACAGTEYAVERGLYVNSLGNGLWWLRSVGSSGGRALYVNIDGGFYDHTVYIGTVGVRPALWLNLES